MLAAIAIQIAESVELAIESARHREFYGGGSKLDALSQRQLKPLSLKQTDITIQPQNWNPTFSHP